MLLVLIASSVLSWIGAPATSCGVCDCSLPDAVTPEGRTAIYAEEADVVVRGIALSTLLLDSGSSGPNPGAISWGRYDAPPVEYRLLVQRSWKGAVSGDTLRVVTSGNTGFSCGADLPIGMPSVVFAKQTGDGLVTGTCLGTETHHLYVETVTRHLDEAGAEQVR